MQSQMALFEQLDNSIHIDLHIPAGNNLGDSADADLNEPAVHRDADHSLY